MAPPRSAVWAQGLADTGCAARAVDPSNVVMAAYTADALLILPDALDAGLIQGVREAAGSRAFPILCSYDGENSLLDLVDDRLPDKLLPAVAAPRLRSAFRAALAEEEMQARRHLFGSGLAERDVATDDPDGDSLRVLFVGQPSPMFLAIESALLAVGVQSEASPITAAALEYAHDNQIDVVIADGVSSSDDALRFCLSMRSNAGLHHVPGSLLAPRVFDQSTYALTRGVSEIFSVDDDPISIARRIIRLARQKRRADRMKNYFVNSQIGMAEDSATGLFTHEILARRLQNHVSIAESSARPLSAAVLRLVTGLATQAELADISKKVGQTLRRVLRLEDTAGAFDWRTYAVLMPASTEAGAKAALSRISGVVENASLHEARHTWPDLRIETSAAEFKSGEPGGAFLMRAASQVVF